MAEEKDVLPQWWIVEHAYPGLDGDIDGLLHLGSQFYISDILEYSRLRSEILHEAHAS